MKQFFLYLSLILILIHPNPSQGETTKIRPDDLSYPPLVFIPPSAEIISFDSGLTLYLLSDSELPLINVSAVFRAGSIYDPAGKEGLSELTSRLLRTGGTRDKSSSQINDLLDYLGASIEVKTGRESVAVNLTVLKKHFSQAFAIFCQILREPFFEDKQVELARQLNISALNRVADDPDRLAFREFSRLIYGDNPRGRLTSIASLTGINRQDLLDYYERFFVPERMAITISGDMTRDEAVKIVDSSFGRWQKGTPYKEDMIPIPKPKGKAGIFHLEKDTPQSVIIVGWIAPGKREEEYFPFTLIDFILGSGGFRSRIFSEIRSNLGLAYSAGSVYRPRGEYGLFLAYTITKSQSTGQVLSLLKKIIEEAASQPIPEEEISRAKKSLNYGFIFSFQSSNDIVNKYLTIAHDKLPNDYLVTYRERLSQTTAGEVRAVAEKYLSWKEAVVLVVGKAADFDRPLTDFGEVTGVTLNIP